MTKKTQLACTSLKDLSLYAELGHQGRANAHACTARHYCYLAGREQEAFFLGAAYHRYNRGLPRKHPNTTIPHRLM